MEKFVALLRGINVGGHKKVPMKELKTTFERIGFMNVKTVLNSGNVVFEGDKNMTGGIPGAIEADFGFPVGVTVIPFDKITEILNLDPFKNVEKTEDTRCYVTFLGNLHTPGIKIPYATEDGSFRIIQQDETAIYGVLDVSKIKTTDAMKILDREFGGDITTRNMNTLIRISGI